MRTTYNKLIRDRVPEIMDGAGVRYEVNVMTEDDFEQALLAKLVEEAREVASAEEDDLVKELADLFEVIDCLLKAHDISREAVVARQEKRRVERGGFEEQLKLLRTESIPAK